MKKTYSDRKAESKILHSEYPTNAIPYLSSFRSLVCPTDKPHTLLQTLLRRSNTMHIDDIIELKPIKRKYEFHSIHHTKSWSVDLMFVCTYPSSIDVSRIITCDGGILVKVLWNGDAH